MKKINNIFVMLLLLVLSTSLKSQENVSTLYFIKNAPLQHTMNPSFQPDYKFYISIPGIGYDYFNFYNSNLTLKDIVFKNDAGKTVTFLHPTGDKNKFYNLINVNGLLTTGDASINVLGFGFRGAKNPANYFTFGIDAKVETDFTLSKDFLRLLLFGTPELEGNHYDIHQFGANLNARLELALGYSRAINEKWAIGAKLKLLYGIANANISFENLDLNAGLYEWNVKGHSVINYSGPFNITIADTLKNSEIAIDEGIANYLLPSGLGAGIDFGLTYKPIKYLTLSAAVTDLGLMRWYNKAGNVHSNVDFTFDGLFVEDINFGDIDGKALADSLLNALGDSYTINQTSSAYTTYTHAKLSVGAEVNLFNDKLGIGILSKTTKYGKRYFEDLTFAINGRPANWVNLTLSYNLLHGNLSTFGAGIGLRTGPLHWLIVADYIPWEYAKYTTDGGSKIPVPYVTKGLNLGVGLNIVIRDRNDADRDGVKDKKDLCPDTPRKVKVDKNGCPKDTDGDGVPDYLDKCPNTPSEAYGTVDENGCPKDTDGDGVPDYLDKCPNTPHGVEVDVNGCPKDSDGDGVPDYLDKCPDTPKGVGVDANGCPKDTDGDGVPDYLDKCPDTPKGVEVDANGCPKDRDGDGVPDYLDKCPDTPGLVENQGCPKEIIPETPKITPKTFGDILFDINKYSIKDNYNKELDDLTAELKANPKAKVAIDGYSDNTGTEKVNKPLSSNRANEVKNYLVKKGISKDRIQVAGHATDNPVGDNSTEAGRALNRRAKITVNY